MLPSNPGFPIQPKTLGTGKHGKLGSFPAQGTNGTENVHQGNQTELPPFLATRRGDGGDSVREGASERLQHAVQEAQHHQKDYLGQSDPSLPALHLKNPAGSVK